MLFWGKKQSHDMIKKNTLQKQIWKQRHANYMERQIVGQTDRKTDKRAGKERQDLQTKVFTLKVSVSLAHLHYLKINPLLCMKYAKSSKTGLNIS